jgi:hypothetical protein
MAGFSADVRPFGLVARGAKGAVWAGVYGGGFVLQFAIAVAGAVEFIFAEDVCRVRPETLSLELRLFLSSWMTFHSA